MLLIISGTCDTGGTDLGSVNLSSDGNPSTFTSSATSSSFTPSTVGRYCFRGEYSGSTSYDPSSDHGLNECFTVSDTSTTTSAQTWLPNDSGTVSSANGALIKGTLSFTLYDNGTCDGNVLRSAETFTLSGANASETRSTTNTTVSVSTSSTVSWLVQFTPDPSSGVSGSSHCESTALTITN
jgi:hypothetical protein